LEQAPRLGKITLLLLEERVRLPRRRIKRIGFHSAFEQAPRLVKIAQFFLKERIDLEGDGALRAARRAAARSSWAKASSACWR
jgi:hypothetical protein